MIISQSCKCGGSVFGWNVEKEWKRKGWKKWKWKFPKTSASGEHFWNWSYPILWYFPIPANLVSPSSAEHMERKVRVESFLKQLDRNNPKKELNRFDPCKFGRSSCSWSMEREGKRRRRRRRGEKSESGGFPPESISEIDPILSYDIFQFPQIQSVLPQLKIWREKGEWKVS